MQLFLSTISDFIALARGGTLTERLLAAYPALYGGHPSPAQITAWEQSYAALAQAVDSPTLYGAMIFLELKMPLCSRRCDAVVVGHGQDGKRRAVVIELKQWGYVRAPVGGLSVDVNGKILLHPCEQARSYASLLRHFHSAFTQHGVIIDACAYLHNLTHQPSIEVLRSASSYGYLSHDSQLFVATEESGLRTYLTNRIGGAGLSNAVATLIEKGTEEPSPRLLDQVVKAVEGVPDWQLIDEQRRVFTQVIEKVEKSRADDQQSVLVVRGGPGTGKSVLALQLLGHAAKQGWKVVHATGSKAFQTVLQGKTEQFAKEWLKKTFSAKTLKQIPVEHMFTTFADVARAGVKNPRSIDLIVGDEAHRLWDFRRNRHSNINIQLSTTPMLDELIAAAKVTVLFLDDNQGVRAGEIGHSDYVIERMKALGISHEVIDLNTQFRCSGSESYLNWVDHLLGFIPQSTLSWYQPDQEQPNYDFKTFDSVAAMAKALADKRSHTPPFKARLVAGFCWRWSEPPTHQPLLHDVTDPRFNGWSAPWIRKGEQDAKPLESRYFHWATKEDPENFEQVGSIYSAQGFEFDYVGVIFGEDLTWTDSGWTADLSKNKDNQFKRDLRDSPVDPASRLRNIYRVLLTRGMKGTYVYCLDPATRKHLEAMLR